MAIIHSMGFCMARSKILCEAGEYSCLASCWVIVEPPPALRWPMSTVLTSARVTALMSIPEWSAKRASSVAIRASTTAGEISS